MVSPETALDMLIHHMLMRIRLCKSLIVAITTSTYPNMSRDGTLGCHIIVDGDNRNHISQFDFPTQQAVPTSFDYLQRILVEPNVAT